MSSLAREWLLVGAWGVTQGTMANKQSGGCFFRAHVRVRRTLLNLHLAHATHSTPPTQSYEGSGGIGAVFGARGNPHGPGVRPMSNPVAAAQVSIQGLKQLILLSAKVSVQ